MTKDGGPAFPRHHACGYLRADDPDAKYFERQASGMSLRDWFAGMAIEKIVLRWQSGPGYSEERPMVEDHVKACYAFADEMLKQREKAVPAE